MGTIQCHLKHSQYCETNTSVWFQNIVIPPVQNTTPTGKLFFILHSSQPWQPLLSDPSEIDLPVLDPYYKQNHVICNLLCLSSFSCHNVFKFSPHCSHYQYFLLLNNIPFYLYSTLCLSIFLLMNIYVVFTIQLLQIVLL